MRNGAIVLFTVLFCGILLVGASTLLAGTTDSGEIAANIAPATSLTAASYPTRTGGGTPVTISDGVGCTDALVVDSIVINDNSILGWTLTVTTANGAGAQARLLNAANNTTIDYSLEIGNVSGIPGLGTGLTLSPIVGVALTFGGGDALITATGTATTATTNYEFELLMTITAGATVGKTTGDYVDTLTLTLSVNH
jgi:hypothetical protein